MLRAAIALLLRHFLRPERASRPAGDVQWSAPLVAARLTPEAEAMLAVGDQPPARDEDDEPLEGSIKARARGVAG